MKFPTALLALATSLLASSISASDFSLVGFAKENPIGATTGGSSPSNSNTTVSTPAQLIAAVEGDTSLIIYLAPVTFTLTARLKVGSNKSLIGTGSKTTITGAGINIKSVSNVIVRNLGIRFILGNDGITIQNSTRVWIDHNEFESDITGGPDKYDGQCDIVRASDWITVSWNYFHDHWKSSLMGNSDSNRDEDQGHLHVTYHHNYWRNEGTRGPAGRFGHQHIFNNLYEDYLYQAIHSRSDNQVLVEGNVFLGNTSEALSTYGLVIPMDSPNTSPDGDYELDGFANLGAKNDWGTAGINITQKGNFTEAPYAYSLTSLSQVQSVVKAGVGLGKI
ncbi:family 1 polysaccharide lyase [Massarina eburnea CBS 473.64]|uniref:pectate lyase n=1 Tax=Massarina eburnea CBS 473.64 TaxID=1395130 RepID=A0A6A6S5K2_9PLEO|nr:family 1 polysaccharide lyase [Massarina eburnea CBS 473.64]